MELKTLESGKNKIVFELQGVGHTFCNLLVQELWKDEHVKVAAYNVDHPLIGKPKMVVETDGKEDVKNENTAHSFVRRRQFHVRFPINFFEAARMLKN